MRIKQGENKNYIFYSYPYGSQSPILDAPTDIVFTAEFKGTCGQSFGVKKSLGDGITFDAETGKYSMKFNPEDTINLPVGKYDFDIKIKRGQSQFFIIKQGYMTIEKSYTGVI